MVIDIVVDWFGVGEFEFGDGSYGVCFVVWFDIV